MKAVQLHPRNRVTDAQPDPAISGMDNIEKLRFEIAGFSSDVLRSLPLCARDREQEHLVEQIERGNEQQKLGLFKVRVCALLEKRLHHEIHELSKNGVVTVINAAVARIKDTEYPNLEKHRLPSDDDIQDFSEELITVLQGKIDEIVGRLSSEPLITTR